MDATPKGGVTEMRPLTDRNHCVRQTFFGPEPPHGIHLGINFLPAHCAKLKIFSAAFEKYFLPFSFFDWKNFSRARKIFHRKFSFFRYEKSCLRKNKLRKNNDASLNFAEQIHP